VSEYRRWSIPGETCFFTVVTYQRRPNFDREENARLRGDFMRSVRKSCPFRTVAIVVLPDHLQSIWSLPCGDADYSTRWKRIKRDFTVEVLGRATKWNDHPVSPERQSRGKHNVWQRRFWEHVVRDETELERLREHIHYNPKKHGYASSPAGWPWSTFPRLVAAGHYPRDWGRRPPAWRDSVGSIVGE
jgi:putative transposase